MTLAERLLALHAALSDAELPHAFGGAIALAYWTLEPRGTRDLDVNVFVPQEQADRVLAALPEGVRSDSAARVALMSTGQARLWWDDTPVDVFLDYAPVHTDAAAHATRVPFEGAEIPVLGPVELTVFKAMFDRTRDWADIEAIAAAGNLDIQAATRHLTAMVGHDDPRISRLRQLRM